MKSAEKKKSKGRKIFEWSMTIFFGLLFVLFMIFQLNGLIHKDENYGQSISFGYGNFIVQTDSMEPELMTSAAIITHKDDLDDIYQQYLKNKENNASIIAEYQKKIEACNSKEGEFLLLAEMETKTSHIDITFYDACSTQVKPLDTSDLILGNLNYQTSNTNAVMTHRLREIQVDESKEKGKGKYTFIVSGINYSSQHYSAFGQYQAFTDEYLLGVVKINSQVIGGFFSFITSIWGLLILLLVPAAYLIVVSIIDIVKALNEKDEEELVAANGADLSSFSKEEQEELKRQMMDALLKGEESKEVKEVKKEEDVLSSISKEDQERLKQEMLDEMMKEKK